jgi:hypothetical protein
MTNGLNLHQEVDDNHTRMVGYAHKIVKENLGKGFLDRDLMTKNG